MNIIVKSWPGAVIYSFQDFEPEKSVKTELILLVFMIIANMFIFIGGSFTLWTPSVHIFWGSGPPDPPGIDVPADDTCVILNSNTIPCLETKMNQVLQEVSQLSNNSI